MYEEARASQKAKGDLDAKRRLLMYISHEIRTPLSVVNFGLKLIKSQVEKLDVLHEQEGIGRSTLPFASGSSSRSCSRASSRSCSRAVTPDPLADKLGGTTTDEDNSFYVEDMTMKKHARHEDIINTVHELDAITSDSAHSVEVAISILNDLLNYEKLEANALEMFKECVPCSLVKTVIDEFMVEASYFKVRLTFKNRMPFEDQSNTFMPADKQKISQVIRNFVSNALKFTPEGGSVTVTATIVPPAEGVVLEKRTSKEGKEYILGGSLRVDFKDTG